MQSGARITPPDAAAHPYIQQRVITPLKFVFLCTYLHFVEDVLLSVNTTAHTSIEVRIISSHIYNDSTVHIIFVFLV